MILALEERLAARLPKPVQTAVRPLMTRALALDQLRKTYGQAQTVHAARNDTGSLFAWMDSILKTMQVRYQVQTGGDVPKEGPLVIVANHPFGLLDPVVVAHHLTQQRSDVMIMANTALSDIPEFRPHSVAVDPFGTQGSARRNIAGMKAALNHLHKGGALLVFPSGEVAHYHAGSGIKESLWSPHVATLVKRTQAQVLPVYVSGSNSAMFHATGLVHRVLRTGLLVREFLKSRHTEVSICVGQPISSKRVARIESDSEAAAFLRTRTLMLSQRQPLRRKTSHQAILTPVAEGIHPRLLAEDVDRLSVSGKRLAHQGCLSVFAARATEIPHVMQEIGRERELAFRAAGEGTGKALDLDQYDPHYLHIFLWDSERQCVAGAYRLGCVDEILASHGPTGLYCSSLFHFRRGFFSLIQDAVEMGRSFIAKDYQKDSVAMPLLWRGIVTWLGQQKRYRKLFGPVSISEDYNTASRRLMVRYLRHRHQDHALAALVKPRIPFHGMGINAAEKELIRSSATEDEDCSAVIAEMEADGKGLPVLLKHYLKLNGKILCFNRDPSFGNVVDGLIMVDMLKTDPRLPCRLMGRQAWAEYLKHHAQD